MIGHESIILMIQKERAGKPKNTIQEARRKTTVGCQQKLTANLCGGRKAFLGRGKPKALEQLMPYRIGSFTIILISFVFSADYPAVQHEASITEKMHNSTDTSIDDSKYEANSNDSTNTNFDPYRMNDTRKDNFLKIMPRIQVIDTQKLAKPLISNYQDPVFHYSHLYFGSSGGFNLSSMYGSGVDLLNMDIWPEWGGNLCVLIGYKPIKWLSIETGASIIGKGLFGKETVYQNGNQFTLEHENRDGFFEFPLIVKPTVIMPSWNLFYGMIGISYARQFKASYDLDVSYEDDYGQTHREDINKVDYIAEGVAFPIDISGGCIRVPYKDLYRMQDASLILGVGWEIGNGCYSKSNSFVVEFKYSIGLIDQSYVTPDGQRSINEAAKKFYEYLINNNLTPEDVGINAEGEYIGNPIHKYHSLLFSIGFRHYF